MSIHDDARSLMRAFHLAHSALKSRFIREWIPQRLTVTQFQALQHLNWYASSCGMTVGELAEHLGLAYSTVSNLVDRLEEQGWVLRQRDSEDRRRIYILLTDKARQLFQQHRERTHRFVSETIGRLSQEERQMLVKGLNHLVAVMESPQWPDYESFHPTMEDSERKRFQQALEGWLEARIGLIGRAYLFAALAEKQHDYELAGYLKQIAYDLVEHSCDLWRYMQDPPDLGVLLAELKHQRMMARDAALEAWRFADELNDERFANLIERARRDVRKHSRWLRHILERTKRKGSTP